MATTTNSLNTYIVPTTDNEVTKPLQPCFASSQNGNYLNVTGDGTTYTVIFPTEYFDQTGDYDHTTGIFTAPVAGKYLFTFSLGLTDNVGGHTSCVIQIVTTGGTCETTRVDLPTILSATDIKYSTSGSFLIDLAATNTAHIALTVSGGAKDVDLLAAPVGQFGGVLLV